MRGVVISRKKKKSKTKRKQKHNASQEQKRTPSDSAYRNTSILQLRPSTHLITRLTEPIGDLFEPRRDSPAMTGASPDVPLGSLSRAILARRSNLALALQPGKRLAGDRHADLHEDALHTHDAAPAGVRQELHAHCAADDDVAAAALGEGQETGADDADVGRGEGEVGPEADFQDNAGGVGGFHVLTERQRGVVDGEGVEGVQFDDPLVDVFDLFRVD